VDESLIPCRSIPCSLSHRHAASPPWEGKSFYASMLRRRLRATRLTRCAPCPRVALLFPAEGCHARGCLPTLYQRWDHAGIRLVSARVCSYSTGSKISRTAAPMASMPRAGSGTPPILGHCARRVGCPRSLPSEHGSRLFDEIHLLGHQRSHVSSGFGQPPRDRRLANVALERMAKRNLRSIAHTCCHCSDAEICLSQKVLCELHAPACQVVHGRFTDE
jgi:hypothetical protein